MKKYDPKNDPLVKLTDDGGAVVQLMKSIKQKGGDISELTFHAPLVEDVEAQGLAEHKMQQARYLVAAMSDTPVGVLRKMHYKDFERCSLVAQYLVDGDQGNDESSGEDSSESSAGES